MHRFFIDPSYILNASVSFPPPVAHQIRSVLRLRAGERVLVLDNSGDEMEVLLKGVATSSVTGEVVAKRPSANEPAVQVTLCLALLTPPLGPVTELADLDAPLLVADEAPSPDTVHDAEPGNAEE